MLSAPDWSLVHRQRLTVVSIRNKPGQIKPAPTPKIKRYDLPHRQSP